MSTTLHTIQALHQAHMMPAAGMANPFDGIVPDFTVFGADFNSKWKKIFAGFWMACLILGGAYVLRGFVEMNQHKGSGHPHELQQSRASLMKSLQAFGGLVAFTSIIGAIIFLVS